MSADGELFKDTFGIASIDLHRVEDESGDVKYIKDKKFDKGMYLCVLEHCEQVYTASDPYACLLTGKAL